MSFTKRGESRKCRAFANALEPMALRWLTAMAMTFLNEGEDTSAIMARAGVSKTCVWRWFLHEKTRPPGISKTGGRPATEEIRLTQGQPPVDATHWRLRAMVKAVGLAASTVQGIWPTHGLAPQRRRQFKLSNDRVFAENLPDVVGSPCGASRPCGGAVS